MYALFISEVGVDVHWYSDKRYFRGTWSRYGISGLTKPGLWRGEDLGRLYFVGVF